MKDVVWPAGFNSLTFDYEFEKPITAVKCPPRLERIAFGDTFDQSIAGVKWPASLRRLGFGVNFSHPIDANTMPDSLRRLGLGHSVDHPTYDNSLPVSVRQLTTGYLLYQPIDASPVLLAGLQEIHILYGFDERVDTVLWSPSLAFNLGDKFNQIVYGGRWLALLRHRSVGHSLNQPVSDVVWPRDLCMLGIEVLTSRLLPWYGRHLLKCCGSAIASKQQFEAVVSPISLKVLEFDLKFYRTLDSIEWPTTVHCLWWKANTTT